MTNCNKSTYNAAMNKFKLLEQEISQSSATDQQKRNMHFTLSKGAMFIADVVEDLDHSSDRFKKIVEDYIAG